MFFSAKGLLGGDRESNFGMIGQVTDLWFSSSVLVR